MRKLKNLLSVDQKDSSVESRCQKYGTGSEASSLDVYILLHVFLLRLLDGDIF